MSMCRLHSNTVGLHTAVPPPDRFARVQDSASLTVLSASVHVRPTRLAPEHTSRRRHQPTPSQKASQFCIPLPTSSGRRIGEFFGRLEAFIERTPIVGKVTAYFRSHALASRRQMGNGVLRWGVSSLFFTFVCFASIAAGAQRIWDLHLYHVCASISASCCAGFKEDVEAMVVCLPVLARFVGSSGKGFRGWFSVRSAAWLGLCEDGGTSRHAWVVMSWFHPERGFDLFVFGVGWLGLGHGCVCLRWSRG